jgi:hypothetical protein
MKEIGKDYILHAFVSLLCLTLRELLSSPPLHNVKDILLYLD